MDELASRVFDAIQTGEVEGLEPVALEWRTPTGWRIIEKAPDGVMWRVPGGHLRVIASAQRIDGNVWAHVSVSHKSRLPTWQEMTMVRDAVLGEHVEAYQVCPPKDRYVNFKDVLHWWACLDKPEGVLPQFEAVVAGVRTI